MIDCAIFPSAHPRSCCRPTLKALQATSTNCDEGTPFNCFLLPASRYGAHKLVILVVVVMTFLPKQEPVGSNDKCVRPATSKSSLGTATQVFVLKMRAR